MSDGLFGQLRRAVLEHRQWPTAGSCNAVLDAADRLVGGVDDRAAVIAHMRAHVTPTDEAIAEILG